MTQYHPLNQLKISSELFELIDSSVLSELGMEQSQFWNSLQEILSKFTDKNKNLIEKRAILQEKIDHWCRTNKDCFDQNHYQNFLKKIGYLEDLVADFQIESENIDDEIAKISGAQLVVPVSNARYTLNAANARYNSLYDALYGTNALSKVGSNTHIDRSKIVIEYVREFLDQCFGLKQGSFKDISGFEIQDSNLVVLLENNQTTSLAKPEQFVGFNQKNGILTSVILKKNQLHLIIEIDPHHPIGSIDLASIKDVKIESAVSAIIDFEDSVAAVDAVDKALVYQNWLGLMRGSLTASFNKNGTLLTRQLNDDITYQSTDGKSQTLRGTSLLLVRNVGHLTQTDAVLFNDKPIYEGMLDAFITSSFAAINLKKKDGFQNSPKGSIYIVKPKMHGSEEVKFANDLYAEVENKLGLAPNTIKLGIMDEERRTSVNLKACVYQVRKRICFINTGFLDRTGDEIHTHMELSAVPLKADFKTAPWMLAYEKSNVDVGLSCGFYDKAQIGKGMWAKSDDMKSMIATKHEHLTQGASCAWVPSPTAASLHAMHYFNHDVKAIQTKLKQRQATKREEILNVFTLSENLNQSQIISEVENNVQGILGYVVRWINQGIGCSKVPDINGTALMEDRATLRISSQHIANWLNHQIISETEVINTMKKMAKLVDEQNKDDREYQPMSDNFDESIAFKTALDLIFKAKQQPNGYTEPLLHEKRKERKKYH